MINLQTIQLKTLLEISNMSMEGVLLELTKFGTPTTWVTKRGVTTWSCVISMDIALVGFTCKVESDHNVHTTPAAACRECLIRVNAAINKLK